MSESREVELGKKLWYLERKRKEQEKDVEATKKEYQEAVDQLMEVLIEEGKSSTGHIDGVGEFKLKRESYPSVTKDRMASFIEHLKETGDGGIVKEVVEASTLKSYLKTKIEDFAAELEENEQLKTETRSQLLLGEDASSEEIAAKHYEQFGVKTFQQVKISHTGKGK